MELSFTATKNFGSGLQKMLENSGKVCSAAIHNKSGK